MPTEPRHDGSWLHPSRLPLGSGWSGYCCAPGHEGTVPSEQQITDDCNLGYASRCPRLPKERFADAVRFCVSQDNGARLLITFVCETAHLPAEHGTLEFGLAPACWLSRHRNACIQKMAECYVQSYLLRRSSTTSIPEFVAGAES
ncbi:MAG TPA: hypothetical protein VGF06_09305 [Terriglobales bacterium]|jgi:hypothetical protein